MLKLFSRAAPLSPMKSIQADYHDLNQKRGFLKQWFASVRVHPVDSIKKLLKSESLTAKDTLLTRCVLERQIKENPCDQSLKVLDENLKGCLTLASLDMWSPYSWECTADMRLNLPEDISTYQKKVIGQINRDYQRGGITIIGKGIYEKQPDEIKSKLKEKVKEKYSRDVKNEKIEAFVERAMIIGTQHVVNDALINYSLHINGANSMEEFNKLKDPVFPKGELPMVTKFYIDEQGITAQAQKVFEYEGHSKTIKASDSPKETVFTATATMKFDDFLENKKEFSNPQSFEAKVKVHIDTQNIHAYAGKNREAGKIGVLTEDDRLIYLSEDEIESEADSQSIDSGYPESIVSEEEALESEADSSSIDSGYSENIVSEQEAFGSANPSINKDIADRQADAMSKRPPGESSSNSAVYPPTKNHSVESVQENQTPVEVSTGSFDTDRIQKIESIISELNKNKHKLELENKKRIEDLNSEEKHVDSFNKLYDHKYKCSLNKIETISLDIDDIQKEIFEVMNMAVQKFIDDMVEAGAKNQGFDRARLEDARNNVRDELCDVLLYKENKDLINAVEEYIEKEMDKDENRKLLERKNSLEQELSEERLKVDHYRKKLKQLLANMSASNDEECAAIQSGLEKQTSLSTEINRLKKQLRKLKE